MAPVIPFIPLIAAGVSTIGGIFAGNKQAKQNEQLINNQNQQLGQVTDMANRLASSVSRADYEQNANADVNAALKDIFGVMATRGMGRSTAALTAASGADGQIRSQYGQQYLRDRMGALQAAGGMISGVASTPRMGYDADPYAGFRSGLTGIGSAAAYYQANGGMGGPPVRQSSSYGASYSPAGLGRSTGYDDGSFRVRSGGYYGR